VTLLIIIMFSLLECDLVLSQILDMSQLIKMNSNGHVKLLFSCVLSFSKKVWVVLQPFSSGLGST
jgi:hypothetical protein